MAIPTLTINDRTTLVLTLTFRDEDDALVVPTAATYRVDDVLTGTTVKAKTSLTGLASSMELEITSAMNAAIGEQTLQERVVTIEFDYGTARHGSDEYRYYVKNLGGVTS